MDLRLPHVQAAQDPFRHDLPSVLDDRNGRSVLPLVHVVVPVTEAIGRVAGELRAAHYHRIENPLSLADCIALATSQSVSDALATTDAPLAATARRVGVEIVALPDSRGVRP